MTKLHNDDNGPKRDVAPGPIPKHTKPDPHLSDDPGPEPEDTPYKGNWYAPYRPFDFDQKTKKNKA